MRSLYRRRHACRSRPSNPSRCCVVCVLASVEHVHRDLELKRVVRHCRNLVDLIADCHRVRDVRAEFHTVLPTSCVEHFTCPGFRHVGLDTIAFVFAGSHNGLIVSLTTLLFWYSSHSTDWLLRRCLRALLDGARLLGEWVHALA